MGERPYLSFYLITFHKPFLLYNDFMAWTQSDVDSIDAALKSNVLRVQFADRSITYRSIDELLKVRNLAVAEVGSTTGTTVLRQLRVYTSKGNGG